VGAGGFGHDAALRRSVNEANAEEIRLKDVFECVSRLAQQRRHRGHTDWTPVELFDHDGEELAICCIETRLIDLQALQRLRRSFHSDVGGASNLYLIAYTAKESIRNTRSTATASRNQRGCIRGDLNTENAGGTSDDCSKLGIVVEVEALHRTEAVAQR
jgi:hypothetical protein